MPTIYRSIDLEASIVAEIASHYPSIHSSVDIADVVKAPVDLVEDVLFHRLVRKGLVCFKSIGEEVYWYATRKLMEKWKEACTVFP
jgi:hypothetical protein